MLARSRPRSDPMLDRQARAEDRRARSLAAPTAVATNPKNDAEHCKDARRDSEDEKHVGGMGHLGPRVA